MAGLWKILLIAIGIYTAVVVYVYLLQSRLIFYPDTPGRKLDATPDNIGLRYKDVWFVTEDNINLHGWYIPHEHAKATLLFFHGNAGNISHRLESIAIFHDLGLNVFIIDYCGYGQSEGSITEQGTYRDAEAAWRYLTQEHDLSESGIIIFGRSLGASIASWLAGKHTPGALIIESGFTSIPAMAKRVYPHLPVRWLSRFKYDTEQYASTVSCPVLVIHSSEDEIIPYDEGSRIYQSAPEPKQFLQITGGHNDGFVTSGTVYLKGLESFINIHLQSRQ